MLRLIETKTIFHIKLKYTYKVTVKNGSYK
jgi:hypothetical protein